MDKYLKPFREEGVMSTIFFVIVGLVFSWFILREFFMILESIFIYFKMYKMLQVVYLLKRTVPYLGSICAMFLVFSKEKITLKKDFLGLVGLIKALFTSSGKDNNNRKIVKEVHYSVESYAMSIYTKLFGGLLLIILMAMFIPMVILFVVFAYLSIKYGYILFKSPLVYYKKIV